MALNINFQPQEYDYFLVLDFEATATYSFDRSHVNVEACSTTDRHGNTKDKGLWEIIEFPVLKVSGQTFETESVFHQYVLPQEQKVNEFCAKKTGITQESVEGKPNFEATLALLDQWMVSEGLCKPSIQSIFVTCGDWDLGTQIPHQCQCFGLQYPHYLSKWINIKKVYKEVMNQRSQPRGMMDMLKGLHIQHEGHHHSGIDDCKNITKILKTLAERGCIYKVTGHVDERHRDLIKHS